MHWFSIILNQFIEISLVLNTLNIFPQYIADSFSLVIWLVHFGSHQILRWFTFGLATFEIYIYYSWATMYLIFGFYSKKFGMAFNCTKVPYFMGFGYFNSIDDFITSKLFLGHFTCRITTRGEKLTASSYICRH